MQLNNLFPLSAYVLMCQCAYVTTSYVPMSQRNSRIFPFHIRIFSADLFADLFADFHSFSMSLTRVNPSRFLDLT